MEETLWVVTQHGVLVILRGKGLIYRVSYPVVWCSGYLGRSFLFSRQLETV